MKILEYIPGRSAVKAFTNFHDIEIKWRQPALTYWDCFHGLVRGVNSLTNIRPL